MTASTKKKADTMLVATDFSASGARAIDMAAALVGLRGGAICLLHVFEPPSVTIPELALEPQIEDDLRVRARQQLATAAAALRARGIAVEERLSIGSPPADVIAHVASEIDPVLVVVGSHGRRPLPRLLMGSVAEGALVRVKQPIVVVPQGGEGSVPIQAPTGRRWRIAVGVDLSNSSAAAVDWVRELRRTVDVDVVFIHLYWPAAEYARFGLTGPRDLFEGDPATVELLRKSLAPMIGTLPGGGETTVRILPNWGPSGERLAEEADEVKADLLVLGTHHRHGFSRLVHGSTVPPALHKATVPIVCVSQSPSRPRDQPIPHLRRILAATDLSDFANRAIAHAFALARGEAGAVHILYVHERLLPSPTYAYAPGAAGALTEHETNDLRRRLHAQIPAQAAALGIATDTIIVDGGAAAEVICQTAERLDADAICMGSHGHTGLGGIVLGSVAARVLHQATRPVLLVRIRPE
jgi:nucleotide-binding universal stress UspA family protein